MAGKFRWKKEEIIHEIICVSLSLLCTVFYASDRLNDDDILFQHDK